MSTIFLTQLNEFSRKFILRGEYTPTPEDARLYKYRFELIKSKIFESLLIYDQINLKVYGENVPLAVLVANLGISSIEELIEQQAIRFTHWDTGVGHMNNNIPGAFPLVSIRPNSKVHCDPEESISIGLDILAHKPKRSERRALIRKIRDLYEYPRDKIEQDTTAHMLSAFKSNKLAGLGLPNHLNIYDLPQDLKLNFSKCAEELLTYKHLSNTKTTSTDSSSSHILHTECIKKTIKTPHHEALAKILEIENFPNLQKIYSNIDSPFQSAIKTRGKQNGIKFRSWLDSTTDTADLAEISKAYIDAIANKKGFFNTHQGRLTKTAILAVAGSGVGSLAGPAGSIIGGALGSILTPVADYGFDLIDEFFLSSLFEGWTPRMFVEDLRALNIRIEPTI